MKKGLRVVYRNPKVVFLLSSISLKPEGCLLALISWAKPKGGLPLLALISGGFLMLALSQVGIFELFGALRRLGSIFHFTGLVHPW